jgi:hypothetical protein
MSQTSAPEKPKSRKKSPAKRPATRSSATIRPWLQRCNAKIGSNSGLPVLGLEASAELRDRLIAELNDLGSGDDAAMWAHR